ncbi:hypothetical protein BDZ91DRAFT_738264 [Kalaharituber pfeilii]|nr:hypothetical protein BDZ91DRAFT_738264 [Kalaharituber pfeilii]
MSINVQDLAKQMANPEGDVERLIIQYPAESPGKVSKVTLDKILIPRQRKRGDRLYTLTPPANSEKEIQLYRGGELMRKPHAIYISSERLKIYQSIKVPEVDEELATAFGKLVETCHSEKEIYTKDATDFIRSSLSALAARAGDVQYESWNTENDIESSSLATKLQTFAENFPPQFPTPAADPSTSIKFDCRELRENEARLAMYKFTLARLLILLHARESKPANDTRIWQLAGLLLALAGKKPFSNFALKFGLLVLKVSVPFLMRGRGGGGGAPSGTLGSGAVTPAPQPRDFPWRKVAACAGLLTVAVAPVLVLGPLAAAIGFGAAGPVAGSIAAGWQASIGLVEAGSLFAMLQGIGMAGAATAAGAPLLATVGAVAGVGALAMGGSVISDMGEADGFVVVLQLLSLH